MDNEKNLTAKETFALAVKNHKKNNLKVAENLYNKILKIDSNHIETIFSLGSLSAQTRKFDKAKQLLQKAIQINPNYANSHFNLGIVFKELGEYQKAINCYQKAIQLNPSCTDAYLNLGVVFEDLKEHQKAISYYKKAIEIQPNYVKAYYNLGIIFNELEEHKKAISCYEKAIEIQPNFTKAHNTLGNVSENLGEYQKAISCYEKAIEIQPNFAEAHTNLGLLLLLLSNFQKGLDEYEWRKKVPTRRDYKLNDIESLEWQGEDLTNKTILILSEQGVGDTIQFARYLYMLQDKYFATIIFRTSKKLIHLFSKSKFKVISNDETLPEHDFHKFLLSLPQIFYKETKTLPKQINYIPKNEKVFSKWKDKLTKIDGMKVGINWQGDKDYKGDRLRSIPLNFFDQLFAIEKINFINLQKGFGVEQIKNFKYKDKLYDFSSEMDNGKNAFEDTIGIMQNLDLVISADTSLVHFSATLGIKTWALLSFSPHWAWFLKSTYSPWYEHVKIYRQEEFNKWDSIFDIVSICLNFAKMTRKILK